jgi:trehalose-6-phosphatase
VTIGDVAAANDEPVALLLDVDGILLDFAERPHEVVTPAGLVATLARAERVLDGALALVSGRAIDDLDRLFVPLRLRASGGPSRSDALRSDGSILDRKGL